jgi:DNA-binding MarR family transcriptional regulator
VTDPLPGQPDTARRPATEAEARTLASSVRLRILRVCLDEAYTNKEIAERLDLNPASTLHHVRRLVATGFLAPQPERRGARGAREVPYRATGKSWTLDVYEPGREPSRAMLEAFLAEVEHAEASGADVGLARLGLRLTAPELAEFWRRLHALLDEYVARGPSPGGQPYSVFVAVHPDASRRP